MAESTIQKFEDDYDDRQWWQVLEEETYHRPLTYFELKGEFENSWRKEFGEELTPEDWYLQVERIRDWHSGDQYEPTEEEALLDAEFYNERYLYLGTMDALLASTDRPLTLEDSKQQRLIALDRPLTKKELQKEEYLFEEWLEYRARVATSEAAFDASFKALWLVLFHLKEDGSSYSDEEADPVIKQHMTLELWNALTAQFGTDEDQADVSEERRAMLAAAGLRGAQTRAEKYAPLKAWALKKASSMRGADKGIARKLYAELPSHLSSVSEDAERLIYDALRAQKKPN